MAPVFQKPAASYEARGRLDPAGFQRHVTFRTRPPPTDLAVFVEHLWIVRWDEGSATYHSEEVMHRPYVDVFVSEDQSGIQGTFASRRAYVASGSGRIVGARFLPGGFHAFVGTGSMAALREKIVDLTQAFPAADASYVERVAAMEDDPALDALVTLLRDTEPRRDPNIGTIQAIVAAIEAEDGPTTVVSLAQAFGKSERWVQQLFRDYLGIGVKWLLQRHRLLAAAARIRAPEAPDFIAMAYDLGYASQQHFNTDFKKVLGRTPTQYRRWTRREGEDEGATSETPRVRRAKGSSPP